MQTLKALAEERELFIVLKSTKQPDEKRETNDKVGSLQSMVRLSHIGQTHVVEE